MPTSAKSRPTYNQRLFSGGLRGWVHAARFHWLGTTLKRLRHAPERVVELGCFDAKTLDYLPRRPDFYHGYDADWEHGLTQARCRFAGDPGVELSECRTPAEMFTPQQAFDTAVCMETLEHVPPELVEPYLARLAAITNGYTLITVPNELGLVFLSKYLVKRCLLGQSYSYSWAELANATCGRLHRVERQDHKGFDYRQLLRDVERHFEILSVDALPLRGCPPWLAVTVGIVGKSRDTTVASKPRRVA